MTPRERGGASRGPRGQGWQPSSSAGAHRRDGCGELLIPGWLGAEPPACLHSKQQVNEQQCGGVLPAPCPGTLPPGGSSLHTALAAPGAGAKVAPSRGGHRSRCLRTRSRRWLSPQQLMLAFPVSAAGGLLPSSGAPRSPVGLCQLLSGSTRCFQQGFPGRFAACAAPAGTLLGEPSRIPRP